MILIRGGGDLASGVALRLFRAGLRVLITEIEQPLAVRRMVSFAEAVYEGCFTVEGVIARLTSQAGAVHQVFERGEIPVMIDPEANARHLLAPVVLIDARMTKRPPDLGKEAAPLVIGLGPGFMPGENCHAAIETNRGHMLGRVLWTSPPEPDSRQPGRVAGQSQARVLRAMLAGKLVPRARIGDRLQPDDLIAEVVSSGGATQQVRAPFRGVLRGLLHGGLAVHPGLKIGDLDPRNDPAFCTLVSEKSLAIGGGVLEAVLTRKEVRAKLWN